ncbi:MAG: ribonuclease Y [Candidatus Sumerlaeaceae bacterium]|nr:ribonuclease Y [Candidatus Sumerlaeaceae bacterium]
MSLVTILAVAGVVAIAIVAAIAGTYWFLAKRMGVQISSAKREAEIILQEAQKEAERLRKDAELEAKELVFQKTKQADRELTRKRLEYEKLENRVRNKERTLDQKLENCEQRERVLARKEQELEERLQNICKREAELAELEKLARQRAEEISGLTAEEAKRFLLESLENDVRQEAAALVRRIEIETKEQAERKARQIITLAIQRCATEQVSETTCSVLTLPSDEMKGRIIGREGRNIRALEAATGVNVIIDDTPDAIVLSSFDPLRREIARQSLEKLIADGRINPVRIEEVVKKTEREFWEHLRQEGELAALELGIPDLHPELHKLLGRLKYRASYGQNILMHVKEVAILCGVMASELGGDVQLAKRAGLLHDIGKAVSHEIEGTHALIGADLCKKYGESMPVVHAVAAHHNEEEPRTLVAVLVQAADALSASRPGARRETLEAYIKRLEKLEEIAASFPGVEKSYAMMAGRELRIMVKPEAISDAEAALLAREVTKRIESEVQYPGQIKVTVLRETRFVEYAK